jgi:hypothetical protein
MLDPDPESENPESGFETLIDSGSFILEDVSFTEQNNFYRTHERRW